MKFIITRSGKQKNFCIIKIFGILITYIIFIYRYVILIIIKKTLIKPQVYNDLRQINELFQVLKYIDKNITIIFVVQCHHEKKPEKNFFSPKIRRQDSIQGSKWIKNEDYLYTEFINSENYLFKEFEELID